ncbi:MAG: very short patch repair endonuclease [Isosphaeraceae bacterium]
MDRLSPEKRSELMSRIGVKNTRPELIVRRLLHRLGFRFRLHRRDLPGKPDIVLPKWRTVIFVHGCFWHGCECCDRGTRIPKSNTEFWLEKVAGNRRRDALTVSRLRELGWKVLILWECETANTEQLTRTLRESLT